jgi:hypothetical protein
MSPASYRAAPPRVAPSTVAHPPREPQNALPTAHLTHQHPRFEARVPAVPGQPAPPDLVHRGRHLTLDAGIRHPI